MAELTCPLCRVKTPAGQAAPGEAVTCATCGGQFTAPLIGIAALPPRTTENAIAPGLPAAKESSAYRFDDLDLDVGTWRWRTTLTGLRWIWWSVLASLLLTESLSALMLAFPNVDQQLNGPFNAVMGVLAGMWCLMVIMCITMFVGFCMCCTAPAPAARRYAITTIVLGVLFGVALCAAGGVVGWQAAQMGPNQPPPPQNPADIFRIYGAPLIAVGSIAVMFGIGSIVSWMLFHATIGALLGDGFLRRLAFIVMAIWLVTTPVNPSLPSILGSFDLDPNLYQRVQFGVSLLVSLLANGSYLWLCARTVTVLRNDERAFLART